MRSAIPRDFSNRSRAVLREAARFLGPPSSAFHLRTLTLGAEVGESPCWDDRASRLLMVDALNGTVHTFHSDGAHVAIPIGEPIGAIVPRAGGGALIAVGHALATLDLETGALEPVARVPAQAETRFNDAKCDSRGRLWAGTRACHDAHATGTLYRFDPDEP